MRGGGCFRYTGPTPLTTLKAKISHLNCALAETNWEMKQLFQSEGDNVFKSQFLTVSLSYAVPIAPLCTKHQVR